MALADAELTKCAPDVVNIRSSVIKITTIAFIAGKLITLKFPLSFVGCLVA